MKTAKHDIYYLCNLDKKYTYFIIFVFYNICKDLYYLIIYIYFCFLVFYVYNHKLFMFFIIVFAINTICKSIAFMCNIKKNKATQYFFNTIYHILYNIYVNLIKNIK